jgi:hypothetical protein
MTTPVKLMFYRVKKFKKFSNITILLSNIFCERICVKRCIFLRCKKYFFKKKNIFSNSLFKFKKKNI